MTGPAPDAWAALERTSFSKRRGVLESAGKRKRASLWTLVHVLWAIGDLRHLGASEAGTIDIVNMVDRYRWRAGFAAAPGTRRRFFDDDAWLGLVALDLDDRALAAEALAFVRTGEDPAGGVRWVEDAASRNTCSTASAAWLAIELGDRAFAERAMAWLDATLRTDEGLYQDRLEEGRIDPTVWSYNQGAAVAALGLLGRVRRRDHDGDRVATAVHGRSVVARAAAVPRDLVPRPPARSGRASRKPCAGSSRTPTDSSPRRLDPATGLFTAGGVGSYDGSTTIDQAAAVQMLAMRALAGA